MKLFLAAAAIVATVSSPVWAEVNDNPGVPNSEFRTVYRGDAWAYAPMYAEAPIYAEPEATVIYATPRARYIRRSYDYDTPPTQLNMPDNDYR
jgi:hypothetical protein